MEAIIIVLVIIVMVLVAVVLALVWQLLRQQPDLSATLSAQRQELTLTLQTFGQTQDQRLQQLTTMTEKKLEDMRQTVDEKLQTSLERRLHESFKQVSERLEAVYKSLGEMQTLANGVGDLKKVLTNVKVRGTWGEVQLGNLLEQFLSPSDYLTNVATRPHSTARVEFAIKLPSKNSEQEYLLLPIDAKFPLEDYQRLQTALEQNDKPAIEQARQELTKRLKKSATDIRDKYLEPPTTTDFAIMYLPLEGLYAEVIQNMSLCQCLQQDYRVSVMGPSTIAAFLSSLQLGFRTLTIEQRSAQVWQLLGQIQTDFEKFGQYLSKTQKKLQEASNIIADAQSKSHTISRRLSQVEQRQLE